MKMTRLRKNFSGKKLWRKPSGESPLNNEDGSVIVIALVVLLLLTMIGNSATNTSTLEIQVAGNERNYKRNFFKTEAAAMQAGQRVQNSADYTESWIRSSSFEYDPVTPNPNFETLSNWTDLSGNGNAYANTYAMVVYTGVAAGSSLDMTSTSQLRAFAVYGQLNNTTRNESMIIETGYAKRY